MFSFRWPVAALLFFAALSPSLAANQTGADALDRKFQSALAHFNSGQYAAAQRELESLARTLPNSFEVQELLGLVYSAEGQEEKATAPFEAAVRLRPESGPARNNLATNLARLGKTSLAEAEFKKVVELEPRSFDANRNLGAFYVRTGRIAAAIPYLEKAQSENPASYDNGYDLALAYQEEGRLPEARREIQELLKQKDTAELHNLLAGVEEKARNYVAAVNEYEKAAHMDPNEANLFDWGSELLVHQTPNPAIAVFSEGVKRHPNSPRLALGLGLALDVRGAYDDAVKSLMRGIDLDPSDARAYYFLSKAYDRAPSQADEVVERFRRFADLRPRDAQATLYYAVSLWKGRRSETSQAYLDQVESLLKKAIALDPSFAEAHLQLGNLYSQRKKYAEAVPEYQQALRLSPNVPDAHFRLGQAYSRVGKKDLADKEFQVHKQLYEQHLADIDKQRSEIRQFVYSLKGAP
ncbi:MAG: tetratricopeptide repeat protein [Acidobacteriia bacterium]|nr:tetratricopeptide repeat protein [Terriglobia bacterium]